MVGGNLVGVMGVEVLEATLGGRVGGTKPGGGGSLVITRVFCVLWSDFLPKSRKIFEKKPSTFARENETIFHMFYVLYLQSCRIGQHQNSRMTPEHCYWKLLEQPLSQHIQ